MRPILVATVLSVILISSCDFVGGKRVDGNGNVTTQARTASNFSGVDVSGAIDVYLTNDPGYSVKVETDQNLQELVEVYTSGNLLRIHTKDGYNLHSSGAVKVHVSAPVFNRLEASGACKIRTQNKIVGTEKLDIGMSGACEIELDLNSPEVTIDASGACIAKLRGETKNLRVQGSGSTNIRAFELMTENADLDLSGAGTAEIFASQKINAGASGATDIRYKGNATINSNTSGAASVKKVD